MRHRAGTGFAAAIIAVCGSCGGQNLDGGSSKIACAETPQDEVCLADEGAALFVSTGGSDVLGNGTRAKPLKTIGKALAAVTADRRRIYVCEGVYPESVALSPAHAAVVLAGGVDCNWNATGARPIIGAGGLALIVDAVESAVTIDHIEAHDDVGTGNGLVLVKGDATFRSVRLGVPRLADTLQAPAAPAAAPPILDRDKAGHTSWVCVDFRNPDPAGFRGLTPGQAAPAAENGPKAGLASTACDAGGSGGDGGPGADGANGKPQTFYGFRLVTTMTSKVDPCNVPDCSPPRPTIVWELRDEDHKALLALWPTAPGQNGQPGSGGGNGPAGAGTGGSGGPGGCPGQVNGQVALLPGAGNPRFGQYGQAGLSSFIVAVFDAHLTIRDSILENGGGGNAAPGAPPQLGSEGLFASCAGFPAFDNCVDGLGQNGGCKGGIGGRGGKSGAGGGSIGGLSAFVLYQGPAPEIDPTTLAASSLAPGGKGSEGGAAGLAGPDGVSAPAIDLTTVK
jgi:hypothetical protein